MNDNFPSVTPHTGKAPDSSRCRPVWASARKDLVGTALGSSRVWFTLADGIITEVYHPRIDIPQIRDLGFIIGDGHGFWVEIKALNSYTVEWTETDIPAAVVTHRHPRFTLTLKICTDPYRDVLLTDFRLQGEAGLALYALLTPRLGENADSNLAWADQWNGQPLLWAEQGPFGLALLAREIDGRSGMGNLSVGTVGASDGWQDFNCNGCMAWSYAEAGPGEVALTARLSNEGTLALGLASSKESAATLAASSLAAGFAAAWTEYWQAGATGALARTGAHACPLDCPLTPSPCCAAQPACSRYTRITPTRARWLQAWPCRGARRAKAGWISSGLVPRPGGKWGSPDCLGRRR